MQNPKTITIYLADGDPRGIRIAEIAQWTGKAIVIPRSKLREAKARPEITQASVYFLFGDDPNASLLPKVYIGKAENLWERLGYHDSTKEFWQNVIAFVSSGNDLDIDYIESRCIEIARQLKRCIVENAVGRTLRNLPEHQISSMEQYLGNLRLLLSTLGYPILQEIERIEIQTEQNPILYCKGRKAFAKGRLVDEGFLVYKGSTVNAKPANAAQKKSAYRNVFTALLELKRLKKISEDIYELTENHLFRSPSAASGLILGQSSNGWDAWKDERGKTLKGIEGERLKRA